VYSRQREPLTSILGKPLSWYGICHANEDELNDLELMLKQDIKIR